MEFDSDMALMLAEMRASGTPLTLPSKCWEGLCERNVQQLRAFGLNSFKRHLARNYFTWVGFPLDQLLYLARRIPVRDTAGCILTSLGKHESLTWRESAVYNLLTKMLWRYAARRFRDDAGLLEEPTIGNPFRVFDGEKLISQDLGNSLVEYHAMIDGMSDDERNGVRRVIELGAGSGRNAHVFLTVHKPLEKYVIVDIPPALLVAQHYLSGVFPDKRIMKFRAFRDFSDVRDEFDRAEICFLLSTQVEQLPPRWADLAVNISSLHEMRLDQIAYWLRKLAVLCRPGGHLFLKQWKRAGVPGENLTITERDWPLACWHTVFWRTAAVQTRFFEALLRNES